MVVFEQTLVWHMVVTSAVVVFPAFPLSLPIVCVILFHRFLIGSSDIGGCLGGMLLFDGC